ncbi:DHH family phosphoesterase [Thermodesulfobacterium hveragerdense]|uniref:DHH family phosphoesterase n=1 Tax=Thermodesulfobacterium hveragerdense TaxID=53424 RepID=UPI00040F2B42|nr:bifunctional oligoribonuclease/PAP phosphatase NrnA [Thermodesulfobacterium hveragerdense]
MLNLTTLLQKIEKNQHFILVTHINPDIDGLASMLSFGFFLKQKGKNFYPVVELIPQNSKFLKGYQWFILPDNLPQIDKALVILFDASSPKRIALNIAERLKPFKEYVIIDHHQKEENTFEGETLFIVEPNSPSTSAIIFEILKKLEAEITSEMAENLLAGLYFDTGGFKYENTTAYTFEVAKELCEKGANPSYIAKQLFEQVSLQEANLLKIALDRLEIISNKPSFGISYLAFEDLEKNPVEDLSYIANFLKSLKEIDIVAFVKEFEKGSIAVSLRGKEPFEVLEIAKNFGGGGHKYASGFKLKIEGLQSFLTDLKEFLRGFYEKR